MEKKSNSQINNKSNSSAQKKSGQNKIASTAGKSGSVYAQKKKFEHAKSRPSARGEKGQDEFEQRIVDIARVTRVMAGGKRMRFRACVAIGNKKGKIGVGLDKGADVAIAVNKAVNDAKKKMINVPIVNDTIPHEIFYKLGAAKVLIKPARRGKGVIAGGAVRTILELAGIKNITSKILGTNNSVNVAKCTIAALDNIKKVEIKEKSKVKKQINTEKQSVKSKENK